MTDDDLKMVMASLRVAHCCRDWPVSPYTRMGHCGICGEVPKMTDKTIEQYMAERKEFLDALPTDPEWERPS